MIILINHSGGAYAYANFISGKLKNAANAEKSSLILSWFFFIDDYFSCLTVGSVIQPVAEWFKIPRAKLAMLVNSMSAPLAVLFPISSWACYIVGQLKSVGVTAEMTKGALISADAFYVYIKSIPFLFYSIIIVASIWYLVQKRLSFGILYQQQEEALKTGNLLGGKVALSSKMREVSECNKQGAILLDFALPIGVLCMSVFMLLFYLGDFWMFGGSNGFMAALQVANSGAALFLGSLFALIVSVIYLLFRKRVCVSELPLICKEGFSMIGSTLLVLMFIWTLTYILKNDLKTGHYLAMLFVGKIGVQLMPAVFFAIAVFIAMLIGTAWGTIGILISLAVPMLASMLCFAHPIAINDALVVLPLIGAIVSGAIMGNHLSPLSDTILMSSKSTGAYHIDVVKAQRSITLPAVLSVFVSFVVAGMMITKFGVLLTVFTAWGVGIGLNVSVLQALNYLQHRKNC